jgi:hypothetical protein
MTSLLVDRKVRSGQLNKSIQTNITRCVRPEALRREPNNATRTHSSTRLDCPSENLPRKRPERVRVKELLSAARRRHRQRKGHEQLLHPGKVVSRLQRSRRYRQLKNCFNNRDIACFRTTPPPKLGPRHVRNSRSTDQKDSPNRGDRVWRYQSQSTGPTIARAAVQSWAKP